MPYVYLFVGCCHQYGNQGIFTNKLGTMHIFAFFPRLTLYGKHQYFVEIGSVSSWSLMKRSQPKKIEKASCQLKSFIGFFPGWKIPFFPKTIIYGFWVAGSRGYYKSWTNIFLNIHQPDKSIIRSTIYSNKQGGFFPVLTIALWPKCCCFRGTGLQIDPYNIGDGTKLLPVMNESLESRLIL